MLAEKLCNAVTPNFIEIIFEGFIDETVGDIDALNTSDCTIELNEFLGITTITFVIIGTRS